MSAGKAVIWGAVLALGVLFCLPGAAGAETGCLFCRQAGENQLVLAPSEPAVQGQSVADLQAMLKEINYYHGPVHGLYNSDTVAAVKQFQAQKGLPPDGVVQEATWQALDEEYCRVTAKDQPPAPRGEVSILIDTAQRKLTVLSDGEVFKQYPVAVGKYETPTPIGTFKVLRRARHWGTGFGTRWIGLNVPWGIYGIHGTNKPYSIGGYQSHGCIRMFNRDVEEIYPWVKPGDRVVIIGNPFRYQPGNFRVMRRDARGGDVMEVQIRLQRLGYYNGPIDGIWGGGMEQAVVQLRKDRGLRHDNCVDAEVYRLLGLVPGVAS